MKLKKFIKRTNNFLYKWAQAMEDYGLTYSQVKVDTPNKVIHSSIDDITKDALFQESATDEYELVVVESVEEL